MVSVFKKNKIRRENKLIRQLTESNTNLKEHLQVATDDYKSKMSELESGIEKLGHMINDKNELLKAGRAKVRKLNAQIKAQKTFIKEADGGEEFLKELQKKNRNPAAGKKTQK